MDPDHLASPESESTLFSEECIEFEKVMNIVNINYYEYNALKGRILNIKRNKNLNKLIIKPFQRNQVITN